MILPAPLCCVALGDRRDRAGKPTCFGCPFRDVPPGARDYGRKPAQNFQYIDLKAHHIRNTIEATAFEATQ
jgi:hypothetical protein